MGFAHTRIHRLCHCGSLIIVGSLTNRGSRSRPRWYASYKDTDGRRKMRALPGVATRDDAKKALALAESNVTHGRLGLAAKAKAMLVRDVMETWLASLRNRNAIRDRQRARKHLLPAFGHMALTVAQETEVVLTWLTSVRAKGELHETTLRGLLTLLSGFWTYCTDHKLAKVNPARQVPKKYRPVRQEAKIDSPWLKTDAEVWAVLSVLDEPFRTAFWLGNRSGLRPGELAGLRLGDLAWLAEGAIRVAHNFDGPLKEDKDGTGKSKWCPAPDGWVQWLQPIIDSRRAEGAGDDAVLFRYVPPHGRPRKDPKWEGMTEDSLKTAWEGVREKVPAVRDMRWYDGTRHSFVSRALAAGASMDEVSAAVGHSSILVTKAAYMHFVRKSWSSALRAPLQESQKIGAPETKAPPDPADGEGSAGSGSPNS